MKDYLEYKEYIGSAGIDTEGRAFVGKLLFIRDVITYSATSFDALEAAFHEAVDDYLTTCAELGDEPDLPCKGVFNVRVGPKLHRDIALVARSRAQGLNEFVCEALMLAVQGAANHTVQPRHRHELIVKFSGSQTTHASSGEQPKVWENPVGQETAH